MRLKPCYWCESPDPCNCESRAREHCPLCGDTMMEHERTEHGMTYPPDLACWECNKTRDELWQLLRERDFIAGFYLGYRFWHVPDTGTVSYSFSWSSGFEMEPHLENEPVLRSLNGVTWHPMVRMEAVCASGYPIAPCGPRGCRQGNGGHGCGIYAVKHLRDLNVSPDARAVVVAKVALWGRVWEHGLGYRAQYAYPQAFIAPPPQVRDKDGMWRIRLEAYAAAWGIPLLGTDGGDDDDA